MSSVLNMWSVGWEQNSSVDLFREEESFCISFEDFVGKRYLEGEACTPKVGCGTLKSMYILIL